MIQKLKKLLKKIFCKHNYKHLTVVALDNELYKVNICKKCGKILLENFNIPIKKSIKINFNKVWEK